MSEHRLAYPRISADEAHAVQMPGLRAYMGLNPVKAEDFVQLLHVNICQNLPTKLSKIICHNSLFKVELSYEVHFSIRLLLGFMSFGIHIRLADPMSEQKL